MASTTEFANQDRINISIRGGALGGFILTLSGDGGEWREGAFSTFSEAIQFLENHKSSIEAGKYPLQKSKSRLEKSQNGRTHPVRALQG